MSKVIYIDNLSEKQIQRFKEVGIDVLRPSEVLLMQLKEDDKVIILCELDVDDKDNRVRRIEFYGVGFAQKLRRMKFMGALLFVSFLDRQRLVDSNPQFDIVNTIGHGFLRLPTHPQAWMKEFEEINILNDVEWHDIDGNYCSKSGLAQQYLHAIQGIASDTSLSKDYVFTETQKCVENIGELYAYPVDEFLSNLDFTDIKIGVQKVRDYCSKIISDNTPSHDADNEEVTSQKWSILLIDDELNEHHNLVKELEKRVHKIYCVSNAIEAQEILEWDRANGGNITLVISDYRLYEKNRGVKTHQKVQGYRILMEISQSYPYIGLAALSQLPRKFLLQSFRRMGIRVDIFSKLDYLKNAQTTNILINELLDRGEEAFQAIIRLPRTFGSKWGLFEPFYRYHRQSVEYNANESYISQRAKAYCREYQKGVFLFDLAGYTTELKGKSKFPENDKAFREFLEKMVCRRIVLWYSQVYSSPPIFSPDEILPFLKGRTYTNNEKTETAKNQINTNLALRLTEFPINITIEEKNWLYEMGLDQEKTEKIEAQEYTILSFAESKILDQIINTLAFKPNTFLRCKYWLTDAVYNQRISKDVLLNVITSIRAKIIHLYPDAKMQTKSVFDFFNYLTRIRNYTRRLHESMKNTELLVDIVDLRKKVIEKANKQYIKNKNLSQGIEGSAWIFFDSLAASQTSFSTFRKYYDAFRKFHEEQNRYCDPHSTVHFDKVEFAMTCNDDI